MTFDGFHSFAHGIFEEQLVLLRPWAGSPGDKEAIPAFGDSQSHEGEGFGYLLHQEGIAPKCNGFEQFLWPVTVLWTGSSCLGSLVS